MWTIIGNGTIEPRAIEGQEREHDAAVELTAERSQPARRSRRQRAAEWCGDRLVELGDGLHRHPSAPVIGLGA